MVEILTAAYVTINVLTKTFDPLQVMYATSHLVTMRTTLLEADHNNPMIVEHVFQNLGTPC